MSLISVNSLNLEYWFAEVYDLLIQFEYKIIFAK